MTWAAPFSGSIQYWKYAVIDIPTYNITHRDLFIVYWDKK